MASSNRRIRVIHTRQLTAEMRPAFERLMRSAWQQNWDDELGRSLVEWRYFARPDGTTWVLLTDDGQCVGLLDSMPRPHMLNGERIIVRETADWYCLPEYRSGLGLNLLRRVQDQGDPILVIGGSRTTLAALPKFRFHKLPPARYYIKPLTTRSLVGNLIRQKWWQREALARLVPQIRWPTTHTIPPGGHVRLLAPDDVVPPPQRDGLIQIIEPWHWQWLLKMPRQIATPVGLAFSINDAIVGCAISQLEPTAAGLDGRIIHLQFTDPFIGKWIVTATTDFLAKCGVGFVRCCVSTPEKFSVMKAAGYLPTQEAPIHWYSQTIPPPVVDAGFMRGDDAMPLQALRGRQLGVRHG